MEFNTIIYETKDRSAIITLNRPQAHNAFNREMIMELNHALLMAGDNPEIRVVLLTGQGKSFCSGMDLKYVNQEAKSLADQQELFRFANRMMNDTIESLPKPVIAVVNGFALAGGYELVLACDLVIADEDAMIGDQHLNYGLVGPGGSTQRTTLLIGMRKAKELLFTGDRISGREAERLGLVNIAAPKEDLENVIKTLVDKIVSKSPVALKTAKSLINRAPETSFKTGSELEIMSSLVNAASEDYQEGLKAFAEKREPQFKGR